VQNFCAKETDHNQPECGDYTFPTVFRIAHLLGRKKGEKRKGTPQVFIPFKKGKDAYSSKAVSLYQFVEDN
jgi:hypothetical protein